MKLSHLQQLPQRNLCIQNAGLLLGHRQTRWINIEAILVSRPVIAVDAGVVEPCVRPVLEWCWASVAHNWPALNQQWAATLAPHWTEIGWVYAYIVCIVATRAARFTGKYRMEFGLNRRWGWNEYTLKIYILTFLLAPFLNYILDM